MGIFDEIKKKLSHEFIDIVEWPDAKPGTIVSRFERYQNEIKNNAKLIVREGQQAVFVGEGQIADVFTPGTYTLNTQNLPILTTIKGWKYGFNSPYKAEVYFVTTTLFTDEKWGTKNPIMLNDDRFGLVEIRAFGTYAFRVSDAGAFIKDIVGAASSFTNYEISEYLKSLIATIFTDTVGEAKIPIEQYAENSKELSQACLKGMKDDFTALGISLEKFFVENVSMPEELKKEIFEYSRLNKIDINKLTQFKTAKAIEAAAKNQGGTAGAGMGMGMGFVLAQQMAQTMQPAAAQSVGAAQAATVGSPPPLASQTVQYYYAIDGKQSGPIDFNTLASLFAGRQITRTTLVWKQGMSAWAKMESIVELQALLGGATPPPLPTA